MIQIYLISLQMKIQKIKKRKIKEFFYLKNFAQKVAQIELIIKLLKKLKIKRCLKKLIIFKEFQ
jgi:hypothetical protein